MNETVNLTNNTCLSQPELKERKRLWVCAS